MDFLTLPIDTSLDSKKRSLPTETTHESESFERYPSSSRNVQEFVTASSSKRVRLDTIPISDYDESDPSIWDNFNAMWKDVDVPDDRPRVIDNSPLSPVGEMLMKAFWEGLTPPDLSEPVEEEVEDSDVFEDLLRPTISVQDFIVGADMDEDLSSILEKYQEMLESQSKTQSRTRTPRAWYERPTASLSSIFNDLAYFGAGDPSRPVPPIKVTNPDGTEGVLLEFYRNLERDESLVPPPSDPRFLRHPWY